MTATEVRSSLIPGALIAITGLANAADLPTSIVGLPFDAPMDRTIKECIYSKHRPMHRKEYCAFRGTLKAGQKNASVELIPPTDTDLPIPTWVQSVTVHTDSSAKVALLWVKTSGSQDRTRVVNDITARFGQGAAIGNGVSWDRAGMPHIYFSCVASDNCVAIFRNDESYQELSRRAAERSKRERL